MTTNRNNSIAADYADHVFEQLILEFKKQRIKAAKAIDIFEAIDNNDLEAVKTYIKYGGNVNINAKDKHGNTPLIEAAKHHNGFKIMRLLLKAKANVNAKNTRGETALMWAISSLEANILIKKGADVNARDAVGRTPLMWNNDSKTINLLLDAGADVNAKNKWGQTALREKLNNYNRLLRPAIDLLKSHGAVA